MQNQDHQTLRFTALCYKSRKKISLQCEDAGMGKAGCQPLL